ncbi:AraC family transcriptional regulator [Paenibacillus sp. ACRRX]|uniref:AraC family transcriptional regulator n=1 Tax=Paenibacillus sp. ACRRX TaxID=2918206 RepID=UPI001EF4EF30|nr:AraC family transcriptional regulator [Paenibacillus sp. ACRRX]MCG7408235.1 AraC family transcriptional regulator [Paenibacillus sp. ACRRX]
MEWLTRMEAVLELIESRMEDKLDMDEIARTAQTSSFHFQRMFHIVTGYTIAEYMRKRKLTLAAQELASSSAKVVDVSFKYGYDSPESFTKAFRKAHGITPSAARQPGASLKAFPCLAFHLSLKGDKEMEYKLVDKPAFHAIGKALHTTTKDGENLRRIPEFWGQCNEDGTYCRLAELEPTHHFLGICTDFKHDTEEMSYWIAVESNQAVEDTTLDSYLVPANTWAVFPASGAMPHAMQQLWERIFQEWFPATGYEHADGPELEVYPSGNPSSEDYQFEVWIPIKKK